MDLKLLLWKAAWPLRSRLQTGLKVGERFPDFALKDLEGNERRLSRGNGERFTFLWFTNLCEDCRAKIPLLHEMLDEAGGAVRVLATSILPADDPLPRELGAGCRFPVLLDPRDAVGREIGLEHPPGACPIHNLFVVDPGRRIVFRHHLSAYGPERFRALWKGLLEGRSVERGR